MLNERQDDQAIAWAAELLDGTIVHSERQSRWRPHWILDVERKSGEKMRAVLRGYRNPGHTDTDVEGARAFLEREAGYLQALQDVPVRVPRLYGHNRDLGWMLMECVEGEAKIVGLEPEDRRFTIYQQYVEELATLHAYPLEKISLPAGTEVPSSCNDLAKRMLDKHLGFYRGLDRKYAEPTQELGLQWTIHNDVPDERPICLGLCDVGPNQFMFKGDRMTSLIDIEYAMITDPLFDVAMMRTRDVTCHIGRMTEHVNHYAKVYKGLTGIEMSLDSLFFWTIAGPALWNVYVIPGMQDPSPTMVDAAFMFAWEVQQKRCIIEGLAEKYGITLAMPEAPKADDGPYLELQRLAANQFDAHYAGQAEGEQNAEFVRYSRSIADSLVLANRWGPDIDRANREELGALLGRKVDNFNEAMFELERAIAQDHMADLERRLAFLYNFEVRRELVYRPMQDASGVTPMYPLPRMHD